MSGGNPTAPVVLHARSKLTILREERRPSHIKGHKTEPWVLCRCECGTEKWARRHGINRVLSCGCATVAATKQRQTTHGQSRSRAYRIWHGIRQRCCNENKREYPDYGGRGICICPEWTDFAAFYAHVLTLLPDGMTDIPKHLTIERKDTDGHYEPSNVILATRTQQNRNTRRNHLVTVDGVTKSIAEWAEVKGVPYYIPLQRIHNGWDPALAVTTPMKYRRKKRKSDLPR